jgi:pyruvate-formate lyase
MLILDVQIAMNNVQPTLSVFYHNNMREDFLHKAVELVRGGSGQPQFMNNTVAVQRNLQRWSQNNITLEDARNVANFGCVATGVCGKSALNIECNINVAKIFELALNNGVDPVTKKQLGPKTDRAEGFTSFEEFYAAFLGQMDYAVNVNRLYSLIGCLMMETKTPSPFRSVMEGGCIERGMCEEAGGPYYYQSLMIVNSGIDAANSLSAVKHLVFDQKNVTVPELKTALAADFKGYEGIQRLCLAAPKHGNDDPEMDALTQRVYTDLHDRYDMIHPQNYVGEKISLDAYSVSLHNYLGRLTGALPSGRNAGLALTDGSVSAMPGTDIEGPTAFINSAAKVIDTVRYAANHCNMKFHPTALQGPTGTRMLLSLIKSYCDLGGSHIQFNCVNKDTLIDAQNNPSKHKGLVVRVAGFSAYFIRLDKGVQDEIIKRTEYQDS